MSGKDATTSHAGRSFGLGWVVFALMVLMVLILGRAAMPETVGEKAREAFLAKLRQHYTHLDVSIDRGHFEAGVGFIFEGVEFRDPKSVYRGAPRRVARVDSMTVVTQLHLAKIVDQENPLETQRVIIEGAVVDAWPLTGQLWSPQSLWPLPDLGPICPRMDIRDLRLNLLDSADSDRPISVVVDDVTIQASTDVDGIVSRQVDVRAHSHFLRQAEIRADLRGDEVRLSGDIQQFKLSGDLFDRLPRSVASWLADLRGLSCVSDIRGGATKLAAAAGGRWQYAADVTIHDGRFEHPKLPLPISQLRAKASLSPSGLTVESSQAVLGDAMCRAEGSLDGLTWPVAARFRLTTSGLVLDQRLAAVIPEKFAPAWDRLRPAGHVDVNANFEHVFAPEVQDATPLDPAGGIGGRWRWSTKAVVDCKGVDVQFDKFPYPVEGLSGQVIVQNNRATCKQMNGRAAGRQLRCQFSVPTSPGQPYYFQCETAVPINESLLSALTPRGEATTGLESFVRSLEPGGRIEVERAIVQRGPDGVTHRDILLHVVDGRLTYDKFAYPLFNVSGGIRVSNRDVQVMNFRAHSASGGLVQCKGSFRIPAVHPTSPSEDPRSRLELMFVASDVPMDDTLGSSLPAVSKETWTALAPSGVLDHLSVLVTRLGENPLALDVIARQNVTTKVDSRTLSIRPISLPYRLDVTGGKVRFDGREVVIEDLQGRHGESTLTASGRCAPVADGRWKLALNVLGGSRLIPDADLIASLPDPMGQTMRRLQLRGPLGLRGLAEVLLADAAHPLPVINWDVKLQLEGNRIGDVGSVHSLRGEILTAGQHDGKKLLAAGRVDLDSIHVDDLQITGLRGPFVIDDDRLRMGHEVRASAAIGGREAAASDQAPSTTRPIEGRLFDGRIDLSGIATLSTSEFDVGLSVHQARVPTVLADLGTNDHDLSGELNGQMRLTGVLGDLERLEGVGEAQMSGANIYQLPLIIQIFNQLRISPSEDVAITDGDCRFTIDGHDVIFNQLRLWGDLVALYGAGRVIRGRDLDLSFDTRVSPHNLLTKVIGPLRNSPYALWTIDVKGPIGAQKIERRAMENFGDTLEKLFPTGGGPVRAAGYRGR